MKIFENETELSEARLKTGQLVRTKGRASAGDGGGRTYRIEAAGASGVTLANGNVAVDISSKEIGQVTSNTNLLSNHNFLTPSPDDITHPSETPTTYPAGTQIFSGVFANDTTGISNLTYIDGSVSFSGGDFYIPRANSKELENVTEFVASVADFDGKPRTRGVSFALVGGEYRVTVGIDALEDESANVTLLGTVKFEQGSVATGHEVKSLFDIYGDPNLTGVAYVEAFGASSGGDTDNTAVWEACRDFCLKNPTRFTFASKPGQHYLPNGIKLYGLLNVNIGGNIKTDNESDEVVIGSNVVAANPSRYLFQSGNCTLKVEGMSRGHVEFLRFERLTLSATNETGVTTTKYNVSYSNFYFTEVDQLRMETSTVSGTTAWMNENKFFGGRVRESLTMTGDYPMNNNSFYGFKMEGITITLDANDGVSGAHSNTWHDTRFESNMIFNFGAGTFNNTFINTWGNFSFVGFVGRDAAAWTINDLGENNDIVTMQHTYTDAETIFELNADSANYRWKHFEKQGHQLKNREIFTTFMDTGLIPLDEPIWFVIETDSTSFNYFIEIYDGNGNRIYTDQSVVQAGMTWNNTFSYYDNGGAIMSGQEISVRKKDGVGFFRLWCRTAGGTFDDLITFWRCRSIQKKKGNRNLPLLPYFGRQDNFFGGSVPSYGTFTAGDVIENSEPAIGQPSYWKCVTSGTFSSASATGGTTTGNIDSNLAQISNLSDTSDFNVGDYITASAGFTSDELRVISIDSSTALTVQRASNSAEAGVTIQTVDPVFGTGPNLS